MKEWLIIKKKEIKVLKKSPMICINIALLLENIIKNQIKVFGNKLFYLYIKKIN